MEFLLQGSPFMISQPYKRKTSVPLLLKSNHHNDATRLRCFYIKLLILIPLPSDKLVLFLPFPSHCNTIGAIMKGQSAVYPQPPIAHFHLHFSIYYLFDWLMINGITFILSPTACLTSIQQTGLMPMQLRCNTGGWLEDGFGGGRRFNIQ